MEDSIFKFQFRPFSATPDAKSYYPSLASAHAIESIEGAVTRNAGPSCLIGASGTGKTMICNVLASRLKQDYSIAMLASNRLCTRRALLQNILFEMGMPYRNMEEGELRLTLIDALRPNDRCPHGMLLIVDEAHTLPLRLLEEIRMLTNFVRDGESRVQVVLAGSHQLEERFADPRLESFNQRVAMRCYLQPMNKEETRQYVQHRMDAAQLEAIEVFEPSALEAIHVATDGIPRLINQVCDHSLLLAEAGGTPIITSTGIEEAWADLQQLPTPWQYEQRDQSSTAIHEGESNVIEFGSLGDDSHSESSESQSPLELHTSDVLDEITDALGVVEAEDLFEDLAEESPGELSNESDVQPDFVEPPNPFAEEFLEEEVIEDPLSDASRVASNTDVTARESDFSAVDPAEITPPQASELRQVAAESIEPVGPQEQSDRSRPTMDEPSSQSRVRTISSSIELGVVSSVGEYESLDDEASSVESAESINVNPADDPVMPEYRGTQKRPRGSLVDPVRVKMDDQNGSDSDIAQLSVPGFMQEVHREQTSSDLEAQNVSPSASEEKMIVVEGNPPSPMMRVVAPPIKPAMTTNAETGRAHRAEYSDLFSRLRG